MINFALQLEFKDSHEAQSIIWASIKNTRIKFRVVKSALEVKYDECPVGSTKFCEEVLCTSITPDYYPEFAKHYINRKIWKTNKWPGENCFVKPASRYKLFDGFVKKKNQKKPKFVEDSGETEFFCSKKVEFVSEFRIYIAKGYFHDVYYAKGTELNYLEIDKPYFKLDYNYFGAIDMGVIINKKFIKKPDNFLFYDALIKDHFLLEEGMISFELVEVHHPYACGWYGKIEEGERYAKWLYDGWEYMKKNYGANMLQLYK